MSAGQRELDAQLRDGSPELATGTVAGMRAPGRVVRSRPSTHVPGWVASSSAPVTPTASMVVITALRGDTARRVAAAVPSGWYLPTGAQVLVRLHPTRAEVGLLDDLVSPDEVARSGQDPRWSTLALPRDTSVRGRMWSVWFAGSAAVGFAVGALLVRLAG